ncbi:MAG: ComEC/Rec2 family competence protein, partial [Odoribacter sp.]|nr:ComEC/Rec2 family competence protein [Odoribacter sp.]
PACRQLMNALCLGYKTELDNDFRDLFITTGTVHVLSVSGLHTGAIYLFLLFLLKRLGFIRRKSEILLLPLLWAYACLTGLSPSVVRASTILSFITAGKVFCRTYTPLNALAASAFFTLLVQPTALYSASFLLSYCAYAGILIFYPFLFRLPGNLHPFVSKIYASCCVTIAAQILTLPISAFYFHTVNLNSFLVNLIAIPLATLLLYGSACCLVLPLFVSRYVIPLCELLCKGLVQLLQFFSPYSINIHHLYPSAFCTLFIYGILIAAGGYLLSRKRHWLYAGITACALLLAYFIVSNRQLASQNEILILHYPKQSVILLNHKGYCLFLQNTLPAQSPPIPYVRQHKLKTLPPETGLSDKQLFCLPQLLVHAKDTIAILSRKHPVYHPCHTLIVTDNLSPGKVFPATGNARKPRQVILDGSNNR